jgi:hypothetical protein
MKTGLEGAIFSKKTPMRCLFLLFALCSCGVLPAQDPDWFSLQPGNAQAGPAIGLGSWLEKPAGNRGGVRIRGDEFVLEDGSPIKFWGTNLASDLPFMPKAEADTWASWLAGYGFNAVRFHKFTWNATDGQHSTQLTEGHWERFDYLCQALRNQGIYYGWSHIYGHRVAPADSARLLAYSELAATRFPWAHLNGSTAALVNFADDLQALNIELTVNMLNHRNPHTGLRYAEDPALAFVEFQNEDNIFWSAIEATLEQTPAYRALLCKKFSQWLLQRYGDEASWRAAWGNEAVKPDESLKPGNVYPQPNHGFFTSEYEQAQRENRPVARNVLDKAAFLYGEQVAFYRKFEAAVRATGYQGPIVGSCWQAGAGLAHLLNLHADYLVGAIDRHNYFGGGQGHNLAPGPFQHQAMVTQIGSGLLSSGFQQVSDRPFAFSEWMSLIPNEWTAESAPLVAIYGMGLQGWDASYVFATDFPHYTETIQTPWGGIYNATSPTQLALYPALARMVFRNEVREGPVIANRKVTVSELLKGQTTFRDRIAQDHDRKSLESSVPAQAMAAGRVVISFTETPSRDEIRNDLIPESDTVKSATGQLRWVQGEKGYFTFRTDFSAGMVGFGGGKRHDLDGVSFSVENEFAVVMITSLQRNKPLATADSLLITVMARARNTDMTFNADHTELLSVGQAPVEIEPVRFSLFLPFYKKWNASTLDPTGHVARRLKPIKKGLLNANGAETQAFYYLLTRR